MIAEHDGKSYVLATLQDPAAVVVYDITDPTNPTWDSGAIAQFADYSTGDGESTGESEGLAYKDGYVLGFQYSRSIRLSFKSFLG